MFGTSLCGEIQIIIQEILGFPVISLNMIIDGEIDVL